MAEAKVAQKDIVVENNAGQNVVVVPAGQPVPDDLDDRKKAAKAGPVSQATDDEIAAARGISNGK